MAACATTAILLLAVCLPSLEDVGMGPLKLFDLRDQLFVAEGSQAVILVASPQVEIQNAAELLHSS
eukprot:793987-Prorocentrum_lima.AAC.1